MGLLDIVTKDATDRSVTLRMADSTDGTPETGVVAATTGLDIWYRREGGAKVSLTESNLALLTTAHTDGGILHISDGEYRVDFPDAAFATGANYVDVGWGATGMVGFGGRIRLINVNLEDSVRAGLTALPNAAADAAGGLPISDAGGLDLDTLNSNVSAILTDTSTTLQAELDGIQADTEDIQARLPAALVGGRIDASVGAMAANVVTAAAIADAAIDAATFAADVDAEILSYIVDDATRIDASALNTKIAALTFTVAGDVDVNVQSWKDATVATPNVAGVPKVDITHSLGTAIQDSDFTIASATASTVTLPATYTDTTTLPDDDRYIYNALSVVAGTGVGQIVLLTTAGASIRQYNVLSGTMPVQLDATSKCIVLGSWQSRMADTVTHGGTTAALSLNTLTTAGTVTFNALTVSNATTLTGAVSLGSTLGVTGAITATNASNNITLGTFTVTTNAIAWNAAWDAEVQSEVDDGLVARGLHYLVNTALPTGWTTDVTANSALDQMADDGTAVYDRTTDSLQAIRDRGDSAWTTGAGGSDRLLMVDTTIATLASQTSFTLTAGSADDGAYNGCTIVIEDVSTSTQKAVGIVDTYIGLTKTITLLYDPAVFTMAATDKVYILAERSVKSTTRDDFHLDISSGGNAGIDWANVANPTATVDLSATDINLVDTTTTNTDMRGTDGANTTTPLDAAGVRTAVGLAAANLDTQLADIPTVAEFNARTIVAANYATAASQTTIITHLTDIKGATWTTTDTLEAIRDRGDAAWITATSVTVSDKTGFKLASDGLALVTAWTVAITGNITGNLSGSVGSVTGAVTVGTINDGAIGAAAVVDIWSTQTLTEAYAADGAAFTPAQALYEICQTLSEFAISGTTITVKKRDGTTTAMTYTLDSATTPTSRTRAT